MNLLHGWKNKQKYEHKKDRLKVGKYFQTAFGLVQSRVDIHPNNFILIK